MAVVAFVETAHKANKLSGTDMQPLRGKTQSRGRKTQVQQENDEERWLGRNCKDGGVGKDSC